MAIAAAMITVTVMEVETTKIEEEEDNKGRIKGFSLSKQVGLF